jgi:hypothetical protein
MLVLAAMSRNQMLKLRRLADEQKVQRSRVRIANCDMISVRKRGTISTRGEVVSRERPRGAFLL